MEYGLIGEKLGHSYSGVIHGKIGDYGYELCEIPKDGLADFMKKHDFKGINVTIPYKKDVIPFLDEISPEAEKIGSVNTVVNRGGKLFGYNTDIDGFLYMAKRAGIEFSGRKVIILGSGGTSLTAKAAAEMSGAAEIVTVSRNGENNYGNTDRHFDAEIVINTTPVGMYPNVCASPMRLDGFKNLEGVIDVIYNPVRTELIMQAEKMGVKCTSGLPMLAAQAVYAYDRFFGKTSGEELFEKIISETDFETENIVLIGMPGSGKTTVGKRLAEMLDREFIDTDEYIETQKNTTIPKLFEAFGEEGFRMIESDVAECIGKLSGKVIATGGGIVTRLENYGSLHRNGRIIFVERDITLLELSGRPLSKDRTAVERMYRERYDSYVQFADFSADNSDEIDETVKKILQYCYKA